MRKQIITNVTRLFLFLVLIIGCTQVHLAKYTPTVSVPEKINIKTKIEVIVGRNSFLKKHIREEAIRSIITEDLRNSLFPVLTAENPELIVKVFVEHLSCDDVTSMHRAALAIFGFVGVPVFKFSGSASVVLSIWDYSSNKLIATYRASKTEEKSYSIYNGLPASFSTSDKNLATITLGKAMDHIKSQIQRERNWIVQAAMDTEHSKTISKVEKPRAEDIINQEQEDQIEKIVKENPGSYVKKAYVGVNVIKNNGGKCEVARVGRDSPAGLAGILAGDIIYSVNDVLIEKRIQLFDIYDQMHPKDFVNVKIIRNGEILNKRFQLKEKYFPYNFYIMNRILCNENLVRLAIVFGDISNLYLGNTPKFDHWKIGMKSYLLGFLENNYLRAYKYEKNFSVVDRARTKKICDEFKLQMLGLASIDTQIELGKMLNATHLLVVDFSRFPKSASKCDDVNIRRLIEVESGKTLASIAIKVETELEDPSNYRPRVTSTNLRQDILNYIAIIAESAVLERKAIDSYSKIFGNNYLDKKLYYTLRDIVIPN